MSVTPPPVDTSGLPKHLRETPDPLAWRRVYDFFNKRIECWHWEQAGNPRTAFRDPWIANDIRILNLWRQLDGGAIWFHTMLDPLVQGDLRLAIWYTYCVHHRDRPTAWDALGVPSPEEWDEWAPKFDKLACQGAPVCSNIHQTISHQMYLDLMTWLSRNLDEHTERLHMLDLGLNPRYNICKVMQEQFGVGAYGAHQMMCYMLEFGVLPGCAADKDFLFLGPGPHAGLRWTYGRRLSEHDGLTVLRWCRDTCEEELSRYNAFRAHGFPGPVRTQKMDLICQEHAWCEVGRYENAKTNPGHIFRSPN